MTKTTYRVLAGLRRDGERYRPGDAIELAPEDAAPFLAQGTLGEPEAAAGRPGDAGAVIERIIEKLPELPPEAVAKDGRPVVAEVERLAGFDLTEDEVDYAWRLYREAQDAAAGATESTPGGDGGNGDAAGGDATVSPAAPPEGGKPGAKKKGGKKDS